MKGRRSFLFMITAAIPFLAAPAWAQSMGAGAASGGASTSASQPATQLTSPQPAAAQSQNPYSGSVPSSPVPGVLKLSLQGAIDRGLKQNLGQLLASADVQSARGQRWQQLSALLPHVSASPYIDVSQVNLKEFGFSFPSLPGVSVPTIVGPFSYFDARASLTQNLFDWKAVEGERAATQRLQSSEHTYKDARDLVVLAVGYNYLLAIADEASIQTAQAQVNTAQALYNQAEDQVQAGTSPAIDALRSHVELQTRQQQLIQAKNDFAIQKLTLARVIGLASGQQFDLTDKSPYQPFEGVTLDEALKRAYASRSDYQAALAGVHAAEYSVGAAKAERYPSLSFNADYGVAGQHPSQSHGVMDVRATLNVPIFTGGATHGDILQAQAQLDQSRERLDNLRAQIDQDVRTALFNLQSSSDQVNVAKSNIDLAQQTLSQSRDRFSAGVTDSVEVVQAEEQVAAANQQYISSLYNFNYAKIALARAMGAAEEGVKEYFKGH
ncbi:MAG TPA: TolC family protein [Candidatus Acidoferrales bacterium]|nr:TolC family protein [Candidatus Acidoferrales bacterium]